MNMNTDFGIKFDFKGKTALVTGGSLGIGRETALGLAKNGAQVVISARSDGGEETASEIRKAGGEAIFLRSDISSEKEVEQLVNETVRRYGKLDFAINNAGHSGVNGYIWEQTEENYDAVFNSNVRGAFFCMKHEIRVMRQSNGRNGRPYGRIVNVGTAAAYLGMARIGIYAASKHALLGLTQVAALELAADTDIRVNMVVPGSVQTHNYDIFTEGKEEAKKFMKAIHATKQVMGPHEVVPAILFLCSDGANYSVGSPLHIDSGITTGIISQ